MIKNLVSVLIILQSVGLCSSRCLAVEENKLVIHADKGQEVINKNIYGHFAEHLGRCIYQGVWVGLDSPIENVRGIRTDVVKALKQIKAPVIRWPGGCFADDYHWRDGVGSFLMNGAHGTNRNRGQIQGFYINRTLCGMRFWLGCN